MLIYMRDLIKSAEETFLRDKDWDLSTCGNCGSLFYAKRYRDTCGSYGCENGYTFLGAPSPRNFMDLEDESKYVREFLSDRGYDPSDPIRVKRSDKERTLFASAAGQIFDRFIYREDERGKVKAFCLQPVIRLQSFPDIGKIDGISTSFVNVGAEQWNASPEDHLIALDDWLDLISGLGLYVGNLTLRRKSYDNEWGEITVPSESLKINYRGLEIGIANFFFGIPQRNGESATMSDISFGLERLAWARNRTGSYFDAIGPLEYSIVGDVPYLDTVRTLTLMGSSSVRAGTNNHGSKFRMLSKRAVRPFEMLPLNELIAFYYSQWGKFMDLPDTLGATSSVIRREIKRQENIEVNRRLGTNADPEILGKLDIDKVAGTDSRIIGRLRNILGGDEQ